MALNSRGFPTFYPGVEFCAFFIFLPSLPHLGGRSALDWWCRHATGTSLLLSPCRHHQWEILLPPALHQPPLLLRSIFKQRQDCRATSVCGAWQVCAGPQGGMAQLSFGGISDPEFVSNAPKIVLEWFPWTKKEGQVLQCGFWWGRWCFWNMGSSVGWEQL